MTAGPLENKRGERSLVEKKNTGRVKITRMQTREPMVAGRTLIISQIGFNTNRNSLSLREALHDLISLRLKVAFCIPCAGTLDLKLGSGFEKTRYKYYYCTSRGEWSRIRV